MPLFPYMVILPIVLGVALLWAAMDSPLSQGSLLWRHNDMTVIVSPDTRGRERDTRQRLDNANARRLYTFNRWILCRIQCLTVSRNHAVFLLYILYAVCERTSKIKLADVVTSLPSGCTFIRKRLPSGILRRLLVCSCFPAYNNPTRFSNSEFCGTYSILVDVKSALAVLTC